jgi:pimeloyl-ACP methyl ester carboxylesterase
MTALKWDEVGDGRGPVAVYFHGTETVEHHVLFPECAERIGVRVLMAHRPGYAASPAIPNASLRDLAATVVDDLTAFGIGAFWALGWSGGGPYALACAAVAPQRVRGVGLFASWAPMNPPDRDLPASVRFAMLVAARAPRSLLRMVFVGKRASPGMIDDVRRIGRPWQFHPYEVARTHPVVVWHAREDREVPLHPWSQIDGIELRLRPGDSHAVPLDVWEDALSLVRTDKAQRREAAGDRPNGE